MKPTLKRRLEQAERKIARLKSAITKIHTHVFADLPEITAPPRNRLQNIAAQCQLAVPELLMLRERPGARIPHSSHSLTKWGSEVRSPAGEPRFYGVRRCRHCGADELKHPAGHFLDGLLGPCPDAPKKSSPPIPRSEVCTNCNGRGLHEKRRPIAFGERRNTWCRACGGKGTKVSKAQGESGLRRGAEAR
jgi:hypothetical protein